MRLKIIAGFILLFLLCCTGSGSLPLNEVKIEDGKAPTDFITKVTITSYNTTDLANFDITVSYNSSIVNETNVTNNPAFGTSVYNLENASQGQVRIASLNTGYGMDGDILLSTLTIKALENASNTSQLNLTVNDFINDSEVEIPVKTVNGTFTIGTKGDTNRDDNINLIDAVYLAKHIVGLSDYTELYGDERDVNCDGEVDLKDAIYLAKHVIDMSKYKQLYPCE